MPTYKVLIAEDNQILAAVISKILTDLNIETVTVNTGDDLITAYNKDYFDMVLLDIMMPDKSGLQLSKEIRKTNSHIPIVALTSLAYEEVKDELAASGINHYISKPPSAEELQALLSEYFKSAA